MARRFVKRPDGSIVYEHNTSRIIFRMWPLVLVAVACILLVFVISRPNADRIEYERVRHAQESECRAKGGFYTSEFLHQDAHGHYYPACLQLVELTGDK